MDQALHCWLKTACHLYIPHSDYIAYHRFTDKRFTCFLGGLDNSPANNFVGGDIEIEKVKAIKSNKVIIVTPLGLKVKVIKYIFFYFFSIINIFK